MSSHNDNQNVWFGVAMFLLGLVAGAALVFMTGITPSARSGKAPVAPTQNQVPQVSVQDRMLKIAGDIDLDTDVFTACTNGSDFNDKIAAQQSSGQEAGVNGTPGNIVYDIKSKRGILVSGAQPFEAFKKVIDDMMKNPAKAEGEEAKKVEPVDFEKDHVRGDSSAKIAVIEYSDLQCPYCQKVHPTYKKILDTYGKDVVWVYRHFPLSFHPDAMPLAVGAECAAKEGGQEAFWSFVDAVLQ